MEICVRIRTISIALKLTFVSTNINGMRFYSLNSIPRLDS